MAILNNRYSTAYANANSFSAKDKSRGINRGDIVIDGYNYGKNWSEGDQVKYDLYLKSLEFDNNVDMMNYLNEYNSPASQVQRMHDAGLNPDFQNLSPDSASGQNVTSPEAPTGESYSDSIIKYSNFAQQFLELIPQAFQMYQSIQGGFLDLDQKALGITSSIDSLAQQEISKQVHLNDLGNYGVLPKLVYHHYPRRLQRKIEKQANSYLNDPRRHELARSFVYNAKLAGETPRQQYLNLLSRYGYNVNDEAFTKVLKTFNDVMADSQLNQSKFNSDYYGNKNGKTMAETENTETQKRGKVAENDAYAELMAKANKLIDSKDKSDKVGGYVMYLLLGLMQNVSFTRSSGPNGSTSSFGF